MSVVWSSHSKSLSGSMAANAASASLTPLSTLVYRSRAVEPIQHTELQQLIDASQARNKAESITGLLIHEDGCFFQWLEGPTDSLSRVWQSIRNDARHTAIEIVGDAPTPVRFFGDWSLKLAESRTKAGDGLPYEALSASDAVVGMLRHRPGSLLHAMTLLEVPDADPEIVLRRVVTDVVIPRLLARHPAARALRPLPPPSARVAELAGLLVAVDPTAAYELVRILHTEARSQSGLYASVFEPSARCLGDLWSSDDCSEVDVTLGMCRLQTALRHANFGQPAPMALRAQPGVVLVAPQPGELHMLGSVLDAELLLQAGWSTHCEYPATDQALQDMLAETWFDALDLSMSLAFAHGDRLARMAQTITQARHASRNPRLRVVVGGRVFSEQSDAGRRVGADASSASAAHVAALMPVPSRPGA